MNDLISIIMPSYNTGGYIADSIRSVQAQSYPHWELLIVDDCSTDSTEEAIAPFLADERIRFFRNEKNSGAAISRNRALREAQGEYIAFLDSDDLWLPDKLERQLAFMKENGYAFTCTDYFVINRDGTLNTHVITAPAHMGKREIYRYCYPATLTTMYERATIGLIQVADLKKNNDYAMWLQAIEQADCHHMPAALSAYRQREGSISSINKWRLIRYHYILFRRGMGLGVISSLFCTVRNLFFGVLKKLRYKRPIAKGEQLPHL